MTRVHGLEAMQVEAARFAASLTPARKAIVVTISGVLGAGKTTFVQTVARHFGIEETVTSPTFVIEKVYMPQSGPFTRLVHIDAYRLSGAQELQALGWRELVAEPGTLILLEWPERVPGVIPEEAIHVSISIAADDSRELTYDGKE